MDYKDLGRPKLWKKRVSTWSLRESAASSLCVLQCPDLDGPHLSLVPTDLHSHRPSSQPWDDCQVCSAYLGFQAMHLMLFEDSRDPCRLLVTTAGSPSQWPAPMRLYPFCPQSAYWRCHPSVVAAAPPFFPQFRADCQKAGSHSCAREPSPQKERLGVEPLPCHVQKRGGDAEVTVSFCVG